MEQRLFAGHQQEGKVARMREKGAKGTTDFAERLVRWSSVGALDGLSR